MDQISSPPPPHRVKQELDLVLAYLPRPYGAPTPPLDLTGLCKPPADIPYLVKYKLDAGKHVKLFQCKLCLKEFGHQYTLMRHLPTHTDERRYQCTTCGKAFRQMSTLSQHRAIHSHERPYVCEVCEKSFNRVSTLISHRKTHTGRKPHQCHLCSKAFHQKGNLRNHIFTHTNERPYKCEDCGKGFNQMSNLMCHKLKSHQRVEGGGEERAPYGCRKCPKAFARRGALRSHEVGEHRKVEEGTGGAAAAAIVLVEPIRTKAMQTAIEGRQIPFALLRPLTGIPVLVRVLPAENGKQMLVPASADDLKKYGQISVSEKGAESGTTVQIKIPVVATVIQQSEDGGKVSMAIVSPGPEQQRTDDGAFVFTAHEEDYTTKNEGEEMVSFNSGSEESCEKNEQIVGDDFVVN